jgi:two-component system OmpR family sensor kinase/two-component system phosphate regulon sensor histidine kinase PhoR
MGRKPLSIDKNNSWIHRSPTVTATNAATEDPDSPDPADKGLEPCMEQILQGLSDACLMITGTDRIIFANDSAKSLLRPKGRILGRKLESVLGDRKVSTLAADCTLSGRPAIARVTLQLPGDAWRDDRHFEVSAVPIRLSETRCYVRIALRDDDEARREAASADPFVDVSIQLKNPLSIVQGYLENLLDGMISEPVLLRQSLLTMRKHTLQIERVIDGLRR